MNVMVSMPVIELSKMSLLLQTALLSTAPLNVGSAHLGLLWQPIRLSPSVRRRVKSQHQRLCRKGLTATCADALATDPFWMLAR